MGLIFCSECGRRISDEAESCPHCGVPVRHKNRQLGKIEKQEKSGDKNYALVVIGYLICVFSFLIYPVLWELAVSSLESSISQTGKQNTA